MRQFLWALALLFSVAQMPTGAFADDHAARAWTFGNYSDSWEVRLGGGAYDFGPFSHQIFSGGIVNAEVLAPSPEFLSFIGSPRPYIGTDVAISNDPIHVVYAGLNWEFNLTERLYLSAGLGGSINSSPTTTNSAGQTKSLGSSVLFHLQGGVGFDITERLTAQVFFNHYSNASTRSSNAGLESIGGRLGLRF